MSLSVLITGSNRGIGRELLKRYLAQPSRTVISAIRDDKHPTADEIRKFPVAEGSRHIVVKLDSNVPADAEAAVKTLQSQYGITKLDTVIANAGIGKSWDVVAKTPIREVEDHFLTNAVGPFALYLATRFLLLASKEPRFVVISTELGSIGFQGERKIPDVAYGMSKAAVNYFVNKIHHEEPGIIAFPMHPGWVRTPLGNAIAVTIGMEQAAITEEESADAVYEQIETSTREKTSGHFINHKGIEIPWLKGMIISGVLPECGQGPVLHCQRPPSASAPTTSAKPSSFADSLAPLRYTRQTGMEADTVSIPRALYACTSCRSGKRRCDKVLPRCSLCLRKQIECRYPVRPQRQQEHPPAEASNGSSPTTRPLSVGRGSRELQHRNTLPAEQRDSHYVTNAVYFISPQLHHQAQLDLPRPELQVPVGLASLIDDLPSVREIASTYFTIIHPWLPIISKQTFYRHLLNPLAGRRTELALLTLSMKLCCTGPWNCNAGCIARTNLYNTVKAFHRDVEWAGLLSVAVLQAGLLIALYEMGQAMYPIAYLSVGACARYGLALGVDQSIAPSAHGYGAQSWNDIEESRRVWWAVLAFDRFLGISNPQRPLSTQDPPFESYLPVDDVAWDAGTATPADATSISTGFTLRMGLFARLAQTTFLLGQTLDLLKHPLADDEAVRTTKIAQLMRTLLALVHATDAEATVRVLEYCAQSGLCLSTILLLQEHQIYASSDQMGQKVMFQDIWQESQTALDRLSQAAAHFLALNSREAHAIDRIPIFIIHAMHQSACVMLLLAPESLEGRVQEAVKTVRDILRLTSPRWRLAGVYLTILESREVSASISAD